mgnify:CR=1 FL=1
MENSKQANIWFLIPLFILIAGFALTSGQENDVVPPLVDTVYVEEVIYVDTGDIYQEAIDHLKEHEGFRSYVYYDTDSSKTIGYGHHLNSNEKFTSITEEEADLLLKEDLEERIQYVETKVDTLNSTQTLALALFAFNCGVGNLNKAISAGILKNIGKLKQYCHYKTVENGELVTKRSTSLYNRRKFEIYLFKR